MELGIKTIATIIMLLVVLLVVGVYFTRGSKDVYDRAGKFEQDATHEGGSGWAFDQFLRSAWYGGAKDTAEVVKTGTIIEAIRNKIKAGEGDYTSPQFKADSFSITPGKNTFVIEYDGTESEPTPGNLVKGCKCCPVLCGKTCSATGIKVHVMNAQGGVSCEILDVLPA